MALLSQVVGKISSRKLLSTAASIAGLVVFNLRLAEIDPALLDNPSVLLVNVAIAGLGGFNAFRQSKVDEKEKATNLFTSEVQPYASALTSPVQGTDTPLREAAKATSFHSDVGAGSPPPKDKPPSLSLMDELVRDGRAPGSEDELDSPTTPPDLSRTGDLLKYVGEEPNPDAPSGDPPAGR